MSSDTRDHVCSRLQTDLVGPQSTDEVIADRPTDRYLTGIIFPIGRLPEAEDESLGVGDSEPGATVPDDGAPLSSSFRPSSMGISFCAAGSAIHLLVKVELAKYVCRWLRPDKEIDNAGEPGNHAEQLTDEEGERKNERWCRVPLVAEFPLMLDTAGPTEIDLSNHCMPQKTQLYVQTAAIDGGFGVTAVLINANQESRDRRSDTENTFFQTCVTICPVGGTRLIPRPHRSSIGHADNSEDEDSGELIYRDVKEYAVGHTCAATWKDAAEEVQAIVTDWIPTSIVPATSAEGDAVFGRLTSNPQLQPRSAAWLASASKEDLLAGLRLVTSSYAEWIAQQQPLILQLPARYRPTGDRHRKQWENALKRMQRAIALLEEDESARKAFQLGNQAMESQRKWADGRSLTWRPFQLGFQLLVLASLDPADENHEVMDLLWFPTGGGKTEAYLGLIAYLVLYRRLRPGSGKSSDGVTVIMRYTLRLLTTQQFERAARLICACESIRRTDSSLGSTPISIGLWVGSAATANDVASAHADSAKSSLQIAFCPECGKKVHCPRNAAAYEIFCENVNSCSLAHKTTPLPIWTVDEDIYRVLPTLLVGTVDKFAQIVRKPETGKFFGVGTSNHPPELILQDELHLITGPLGTIAGLYEVAIDELCLAAGGRPKVIGSTATIRRAADQVLALFNRRVYQYPAPGLSADNSCFSVRDDSKPGRLYLGVTSAGRSPKFTLQAVAASLLQASNDAAVAGSHADNYWTLLTYFNSLRELGGAHVLMLDDVPKSITEYAQRHKEVARSLGEPVELSSNLDQAEIPQVLRALSIARGLEGSIDVALATNMVSVGMDIPRLALMIVNGQPKTVSEYIQATSRVGRDAVPGMVITCFNVNKPRDRSHYETFSSWHGRLYRDVEATSVTPFAPRAQDKALHGVLVALVRHTVKGMAKSPSLSATQRALCGDIEKAIANRAQCVDRIDGPGVPRKLAALLDQWEQRSGITRYWNDTNYNKHPTLMMSAEAYAALKAVGRERADIWPTMNSMREVEPSCSFKLVEFLKVDDISEQTAPELDEELED